MHKAHMPLRSHVLMRDILASVLEFEEMQITM